MKFTLYVRRIEEQSATITVEAASLSAAIDKVETDPEEYVTEWDLHEPTYEVTPCSG